MKKIDFDNDSIKKNILQAALPMLAAQILSLLYNIVDRIYIARIPDMGTTALGAVGALLSYYNADNRFLQSLWKRWCSTFFNKKRHE